MTSDSSRPEPAAATSVCRSRSASRKHGSVRRGFKSLPSALKAENPAAMRVLGMLALPMTAPAGFEGFFRELAAAHQAGTLDPRLCASVAELRHRMGRLNAGHWRTSEPDTLCLLSTRDFRLRAVSDPVSVLTPDRRVRVFISSTLGELAPERDAVEAAVRTLRMTPVRFEVGARAHRPDDAVSLVSRPERRVRGHLLGELRLGGAGRDGLRDRGRAREKPGRARS